MPSHPAASAGQLLSWLPGQACGLEHGGQFHGIGITDELGHLISTKHAIALELAFAEPLVERGLVRKCLVLRAIGAHVGGNSCQEARLDVEQLAGYVRRRSRCHRKQTRARWRSDRSRPQAGCEDRRASAPASQRGCRSRSPPCGSHCRGRTASSPRRRRHRPPRSSCSDGGTSRRGQGFRSGRHRTDRLPGCRRWSRPASRRSAP